MGSGSQSHPPPLCRPFPLSQTLGKCAKMIPVMIWGTIILKKRYSEAKLPAAGVVDASARLRTACDLPPLQTVAASAAASGPRLLPLSRTACPPCLARVQTARTT